MHAKVVCDAAHRGHGAHGGEGGLPNYQWLAAASEREYLLPQVRQDAMIEKQLLLEARIVFFDSLHNIYAATPLSIASCRLATSPSDQNNRNVIAWPDRLEEGLEAAGR
ncbi:hypothetical protein FOMPIDRAFT_1052795 [Fomitopsis schrenkii]|uniref:Uncharacterized protein n=1 Tax=Fomitopsis schrenkii TaxID=2126942 RepID=S8FEV0_FOMSC|nr:hypothetical protein FOMPIDRAFT_1052795 [Fomitopsis schrenkii]